MLSRIHLGSMRLLAVVVLLSYGSTELVKAQGVPPSRTVSSAVLSDHVYGLNIPPGQLLTGASAEALPAPNGYKVVGALNNPATGFQGVTYQHNASGQVTVVYRGTDDRKDLSANASIATQGGRGLEAQLNDARQLTNFTTQAYGRDNTALAGHSLGGGIAQVEAARTGLTTNTYNAPGMRSNVAEHYPKADATKINNHNRGDDLVSRSNTQVGYSSTYPSVDDGIKIRGPDGQVTSGRVTATPLEILTPGAEVPVTRSAAYANHNMHGFATEMRAGTVPLDAPTYQPIQGAGFKTEAVTETQLRERFNATSAQNQAAASSRAAAAAEPFAQIAPTMQPAVPAFHLLPLPTTNSPPRTAAAPSGAPAGGVPNGLAATTKPPVAAKPDPVPTKDVSAGGKNKACNKTYKTKDGCHPGHNEKGHPGGCRC